MEVKRLMLDPNSNLPIVILGDATGARLLPIWIGLFEANAIAMRLEAIDSPRPMTHDIFAHTLTELAVTVERVEICDLRENTFFANLHISRAGESSSLDSRPSDAIALALRMGAPIFVLPKVLAKAQTAEARAALPDEEKIRAWLEQAGPEDLGDYEM